MFTSLKFERSPRIDSKKNNQGLLAVDNRATRVDFNYLRFINVKEWKKMWIYIHISAEKTRR